MLASGWYGQRMGGRPAKPWWREKRETEERLSQLQRRGGFQSSKDHHTAGETVERRQLAYMNA